MQCKKYIPEAGDIVWINSDHTQGHEQRGRRPAVVITPREYNELSGLVICCLMTRQVKGYPFEVMLAKDSVVLVDQVRTLDWNARECKKDSSIDPSKLEEVRTKLGLVAGITQG